MDLNAVRKALHAYADPAKARVLRGFFKTGKGQYGEGDIFIGVNVPETRSVAKTYADLKTTAILKLLASPIHEERLLALLILIDQYCRGHGTIKKSIFTLYLKNTAHINNWDLVDLSAPNIVGNWLLGRNRKILYELARSKNMWERRIAIVATHAFIRAREFDDTFAIADILMNDKEDLLHKATGWMLREAGKRDAAALKNFLKPRLKVLPRTALRYAIEKFPEEERQKYLKS